MTKKIFIIAGEPSGDVLGSGIIKEMPNVEFVGIGGKEMEEAGLKSLFDIKKISVMGIFEVLPRIFKILGLIKKTVKEIKKQNPDLILTIDSPSFCFRVIKFFKNNKNIKKVHLIAPSVWAWKEKRAKKISKLYDLLLCILPFEPPLFEKYGLKSKFIGHPIFDGVETTDLKLCAINQTIVLTPGSRDGEVKKIFPIMMKTINILKNEYGYELNVYVFATYKTLNLVEYMVLDEDFYCNIVVDKEEKNKIMDKANFAIAKSGTNAFEFNIYSIPLVIVYTMNYLTNKLGKLLIKVKFANIVNIMANAEIIPEFIGDNAKPYLIAAKTDVLLRSNILLSKQVEETKNIIKDLGYLSGHSSAKKCAKEIKKLLI
ncbi:MAG: lipid-A-disaccharide synthase [Rickettsiales bacterium]|jgi:lipid-A-disaccharide synthase|nr:lipid-A-disaccharide synthase [Rickettsiales bacterium]